MLPLDAWRPLVHAHRAVMILPPYPCVDHENGYTLDMASMEIQVLASERAIPINGTYTAREMRHCAAEQEAWATLDLQPDTLYVVLLPAVAVADRFQARGAHCAVFDLGRVCSTNEEAVATAMRATMRPPLAPIAVGYGDRLQVADAMLGSSGWTGPELGGRWTERSISSLLLHLQGEPPSGVALKLQMQARLCGARRSQAVDILLDNKQLATLQFDAASNDPTGVRTVAIPDPGDLRRDAITVQIRPHDLRSPETLGCDRDPRRLGVWVARLWFE
jgi:hypothetical protein